MNASRAGPGGPPLALDLQLRLVGLVADELELLEPWLEAKLAERIGDRVGRPNRCIAPGRAGPDAGGEGFDQVHGRSLIGN